MAKRISDIAKELNLPSKAIIQKCLDEGIPADKVKGHASTVSAGLEASIREWFSNAAPATAVETKEHHDAQEVRAATPASKRKSTSKAVSTPDSTSSQAGGGTATVEGVAPSIAPPLAPPRVKVVPGTGLTPPGKVDLPAVAPARVAPPAAPITSEAVAGHATQIPKPPAPAPTPPPPGGSAPTPPQGALGSIVQSPTNQPPSSVPAFMRGPIRPAPQNIPTRPTVIKPAGTMLTTKAKVELSGPKVVRIEQAETLPERRPARTGGFTGTGGPANRAGRGIIAGPGGGGGMGGGAGGANDARRNKRRGPGGPGGAPVVPPKRKIRENTDELSTVGGTGFTEADLAAREQALARSAGYLKQRRREARARTEAAGARSAGETLDSTVEITEPFTIKDLSAASGIRAADIIKKLFMQGVMATVNSGIDPAKAQEVMIDFDIELIVKAAKSAEQVMTDEFAARVRADERTRSAVVTIMGHVDHGKTSLLDAIRKANVAAGEAGGITQRTSAFKVPIEINGITKSVVFIDTPGHEAFTQMRSRGANVTDVIVLVVGAPEGVMPQTIESINHARAAGAQIVVALNKIDSPQATDAQVNKVLGQLAEQQLNPVEWGGQTEVIRTSATKKTGINELLEILDLQSDVLQLKADFAGPARGRVIESSVSEGRGAVATILIQEGELKVGDFIVAGRAFGRVRDLLDDTGARIKIAGPSTPVQVSGLDEVPAAGDAFFVTESLDKAEDAAQQRRDRDREASLHQPKVTLDSLFSQMKDAEIKEILVVLKADVQGSIDAISTQVEKLSTDEVKVRVLHKAVGGINESDVILAEASKAVIVGFNVIASAKARASADIKGVEVRTYQVIYDILDDVKKAASGMLEPEIRQDVLGHAEVRKVFNVSKVGTIAGCYVTDGIVQRDALIRVTRQGVVIVNDRVLEQLKRFKDDAKDVKANMECGMKIVGYDDIKEGDVLECYKKVEIKRTL